MVTMITQVFGTNGDILWHALIECLHFRRGCFAWQVRFSRFNVQNALQPTDCDRRVFEYSLVTKGNRSLRQDNEIVVVRYQCSNNDLKTYINDSLVL